MDVSALLDEVAKSPTEAARRLGVSDGHIHDLRNRRRELSPAVAAKLEELLDRRGIVAEVVRLQLTRREERKRRKGERVA